MPTQKTAESKLLDYNPSRVLKKSQRVLNLFLDTMDISYQQLQQEYPRLASAYDTFQSWLKLGTDIASRSAGLIKKRKIRKNIEVHLTSSSSKPEEIYYLVTNNLPLDSPESVLERSFGPISFKPENLDQLEKIFSRARKYAVALARKRNCMCHIDPSPSDDFEIKAECKRLEAEELKNPKKMSYKDLYKLKPVEIKRGRVVYHCRAINREH